MNWKFAVVRQSRLSSRRPGPMTTTLRSVHKFCTSFHYIIELWGLECPLRLWIVACFLFYFASLLDCVEWVFHLLLLDQMSLCQVCKPTSCSLSHGVTSWIALEKSKRDFCPCWSRVWPRRNLPIVSLKTRWMVIHVQGHLQSFFWRLSFLLTCHRYNKNISCIWMQWFRCIYISLYFYSKCFVS